jgi:branched-chain amino acid transport system substrate-binding protein
MRRGIWSTTLAILLFGTCLCAVGVSVPPTSAQAAPYTIALVTSLTGPAAPETASDQAGFLARIELQNAEGGVNGHQIKPLVVDDQTTNVPTAVQDAVSKNSIGIVAASGLFYLGAKYPQQAGVPVTGSYSDGPEWGEKPYTNMFASDAGSLNPSFPENTFEAKVLRQFGGTVLGAYGYGVSPSSARQATQVARSFVRVGGKLGVLDTSIPFGAETFSTEALTARQYGVNAIFPTMIGASDFALAQAMTQAGVKLKAAVFASGPDPTLIKQPIWQNLQGDYFLNLYRPFQLPNAGTKQMSSALQKYEGWSKTEIPTLFQYETWAGADLMIKGLQMAGSNPTHAGVIKALRSIKNYTANGLLPTPINYSTIFGHDLPQTCTWVLRADATGYEPASPHPVCGTDIKGTSFSNNS